MQRGVFLKFSKNVFLKSIVFLLIFSTTLFALIYGHHNFRDDDLKKRRYVVVNPGNDVLYFPRGRNAHWFTENTTTGEKIDYHLDENYMRLPAFDSHHSPNSHFIIDGCSFAFGEGIANEKTLSSVIQKEWAKYKVYNFSFIGGSPHLSFQFHDLVKPTRFIEPKNGIYLYVFIPDQLSRWHNSPLSLSWRDGNAPIYNKTGSTFTYAHATKDLPGFDIYLLFRKLGLAKFPADLLDSPLDQHIFNDAQIEDFVEAISHLKQRYLAEFPSGQFVFLFHPIGDSRNLSNKMIDVLNKNNIETLYPGNDFLNTIRIDNFSTHNYQIKFDGHPNGKMNSWLSEWLGKHLLKMASRNQR